MSSGSGRPHADEPAVRVVGSASHPGAEPELAVVVSTRCRSGFLPTLLRALAGQSLDLGRFEVVVVDNGSTDDTWEVLVAEARHSPLRLLCVHLPADRGAGGGRTAGIERVRAPIVAFTDDDCVPTASWLERITLPLRGPSPTEPPRFVVQGRTTPWPEDASGAGPWARTVWVLRPTWLFETCNIAYRTADLVAAGGFPSAGQAPASSTGRPTGEDALLGWRVVAQGARLVFVPEALVHHRNFRATFGDHLREQRGRRVFPELAARSPYARRAFWGRWFLSSRSAGASLAVASVSVALAGRRPVWLMGTLPWVVLALPEAAHRSGRHPLVRLAQVALVDLVGLGVTAASSVRQRTLVL